MSDYSYIMTENGELYHYGVKGMKWGVRKSEYKSMSRSQKKQTRKQYQQDKIAKKAEKRVGKYGYDMAQTISVGKGIVATSLKSGLGLTGLSTASTLYTTTNALGLMSTVYSGATAASLTSAAMMTGIATIPVAALGAYGLYSAGKSIYRTVQNTSANTRAAAKKTN